MRILSSFVDYYDEALSKLGGTQTWRRGVKLDPAKHKAKQVDSSVSLPDSSRRFQRWFGFTLEYLLIAGTVWPILCTKDGQRTPVESTLRSSLFDMNPWIVSGLSPVTSAAAAHLQRTLTSPIALIAPGPAHSCVLAYSKIPCLEDYGMHLSELPQRVALHIAYWLKANPVTQTAVKVRNPPARRLK